MIALLGILVTWWPVLALLHVPRLAQVLATVIAMRTKSALDHRIPDDLPMTAGDWLAERLDELGHPIQAVVTSRDVDAYRPNARLIQLSAETHFKADPVYWATAAHELGHARIRAELPVIGHLRSAAVPAGLVLLAAGTGLVFGRVLYDLPAAGALALRCCAAAAAAQGFVLLDEGLASVLAYRELHRSSAIDFVHLRAIRRVLVTAFATYFATYAAYAALLHYWPLIDALTGHRPVHPGRLTWFGTAVAIAASLGCIATMLFALVRMIAPRELGEALEDRPSVGTASGLVRTVPIVALVWLVWDHRVDAAYAWCAIAAFAVSWRTWLGILHVPFGLVHATVVRWLTRHVGPGVDETPRYLRAREHGAYSIWLGNRRLERLDAERRDEPRWLTRLVALARLGYLPLLLAFWLT